MTRTILFTSDDEQEIRRLRDTADAARESGVPDREINALRALTVRVLNILNNRSR